MSHGVVRFFVCHGLTKRRLVAIYSVLRKGLDMKTFKIVKVEYSTLGQTLSVVEDGQQGDKQVVKHAPMYPLLVPGVIFHEAYDRHTGKCPVATIYELSGKPHVMLYGVDSESEVKYFYDRVSFKDAGFLKAKVSQALRARNMFVSLNGPCDLRSLLEIQQKEYNKIRGR